MEGFRRRLSLAILPLLVAVAASAAEKPDSRSHARTLAGKVTSLDPARRILAVRDGRGKETHLFLTGATRVSGGKLAPGAEVTVRWVSRDRRSVATAVRVHVTEAGATGPAAGPSSPSPTPGVR